MATYRVPVLGDFSWQPPVADKDLNEPAGGESKGDRFIVGTGAGDWAGEDGHIATANQDAPSAAGHWIFDTPTEGWTVWVLDENCYYHYTGAAWDKDDVDAMQDSITSIIASLHTYESALSDATSEAKASAYVDFQTNSNLISNISNALSAVSNAVAAIDVSAVSNLAESNQDSINLLYSSLHTYESALSNATSAVKESVLSDLASAISDINSIIDVDTASLATAISTVDDRVDSVETRMLSVTSDMTASINTQIDSAISTLDSTAHSELLSQAVILSDATSAVKASAQAIGSYIAAYGAIEFTI